MKPAGYNVRILLDSVGPSGCRLTTWELRYPRLVHADLMSHRMLSKNSASSRAIPIQKVLMQVWKDPALPVWWGQNQTGMQAKQELQGIRLALAKLVWNAARIFALIFVWCLWKIGLHKQLSNRILEPWMFITIILSATEFDNWFGLRDHPDAQPELAWVAGTMRQLYRENIPQKLKEGQWHLPFLIPEEYLNINCPGGFSLEEARKISVGRCCRVSYLTHNGNRDPLKDIELHDKLKNANPGHWSPFEHVAMALPDNAPSGNFRGWKQYRKFFPEEHIGGIRT